MEIDELILEILELNPQKLYISNLELHYLFYKDITLCFSNLTKWNCLVHIQSCSTQIIFDETKNAVLEYFNKKYSIDEIAKKINNEIRKDKLIQIENANN